MAKFDELRSDFNNWLERHREYQLQSTQFAHRFAAGFREYIGAPEHYTDMRKRKQLYVEACKITDDGEYISTKNRLELLKWNDDGYLSFGIRFVLDIKPNAYPKRAFLFSVRFRNKIDECEMIIAEKTFNFRINDNEARKEVYAYMADLLTKGLKREPWEGTEKQQFGYVTFKDK
jgi:hypothetical protein